MKVQGKYAEATILTDVVDDTTLEQIKHVLDQPMFENEKIVIQPDCHAGKGCVIGFTSTYTDKIIPNLVGVDISCGMLWIKIGKNAIDLPKFDKMIREYIPAGNNAKEFRATIRKSEFNLENLRCYNGLHDTDWIMRSIGTLGGGNHFIELDVDEYGDVYLVIHSGSRNLGKQVAEYYQDLALKRLNKDRMANAVRELVDRLKSEGRQSEIQVELKKMALPKFDKDLAYLEGEDLNDYIHDVELVAQYAKMNREEMAMNILWYLTQGVVPVVNIFRDSDLVRFKDRFEFHHTVHNYIDAVNKIIRKGACSATKDELLIIPINMRDGSLICIGEGLEETNYSAPHGAGRIMSRRQAKDNVSLEDYQKSMKGIYTTSVDTSTLDESPFAYKRLEDIERNLVGVRVLSRIKPIYNFKAGE